MMAGGYARDTKGRFARKGSKKQSAYASGSNRGIGAPGGASFVKASRKKPKSK